MTPINKLSTHGSIHNQKGSPADLQEPNHFQVRSWLTQRKRNACKCKHFVLMENPRKKNANYPHEPSQSDLGNQSKTKKIVVLN